jgi:hypothetical protein
LELLDLAVDDPVERDPLHFALSWRISELPVRHDVVDSNPFADLEDVRPVDMDIRHPLEDLPHCRPHGVIALMRYRAVAVEDHGVRGVIGHQPMEVLLVVGFMLSEDDREGIGERHFVSSAPEGVKNLR